MAASALIASPTAFAAPSSELAATAAQIDYTLPPEDSPLWDEPNRQWDEMTQFIEDNPGDFAGLEELSLQYTGLPLTVSVSDYNEELTGVEAQSILDKRAELPDNAEVQSKRMIGIANVPQDAFTVSFAWIPRPAPSAFVQRAAYGTWNIRDDYVNYSEPDDVAALRIAADSCYSLGDTTTVKTYTYQGVETSSGYLRDAGLGTNSPIGGIDDRVSGFIGNADNGYMLHEPRISCGPSEIRGMFTYEHNQDGGAIASVSASFGAFSISYSGATSALQKSSNIANWNT